LGVVGETGAQTAEGICGTDDDWVPYFFGGGEGIVDGTYSGGCCDGDIDFCPKLAI
jgi:hypothetical protein